MMKLKSGKSRMPIVLYMMLALLFTQCIPQKKLLYLQNKKASVYDSTNVALKPYKIRSNDNLFVQITTTSKANFDFTTLVSSVNLNPYYISYTVSDSGSIVIPMVGEVFVKGMTADEAKGKIQEAVNAFVTNATVNVKISNFKLTILGDVRMPGVYYISENKLNIFEALGHAGDMTTYGNRKKVMIIRENEKGEKNSFYLDLTDKRLIYSEKYYVMHNDIIYIEPNTGAKTSGFAEIPWSVIVSSISTTILILSFIASKK